MFFGSSSGCGAPMMYTPLMSPVPPRALFWTTTNKLPKIYTANHATFPILVHSRYTRMASFGRREIEYMQPLCKYNKYIQSYSVQLPLRNDEGRRSRDPPARCRRRSVSDWLSILHIRHLIGWYKVFKFRFFDFQVIEALK